MQIFRVSLFFKQDIIVNTQTNLIITFLSFWAYGVHSLLGKKVYTQLEVMHILLYLIKCFSLLCFDLVSPSSFHCWDWFFLFFFLRSADSQQKTGNVWGILSPQARSRPILNAVVCMMSLMNILNAVTCSALILFRFILHAVVCINQFPVDFFFF